MEVDAEHSGGLSGSPRQREGRADVDMEAGPSFTPPTPFDISNDPYHNLFPEFLASLQEEDPSDSIAYTLPIYLSAQLAPSLQLFQYPLHHRPITVPPYAQSKGHTITARMKEAVERFELEVPVDMREDVWDEEKAEEMGFQGRNGASSKEDKKKVKMGSDGWGSKMRLRSEEVPHVTGYWSGIVHDSKSVPVSCKFPNHLLTRDVFKTHSTFTRSTSSSSFVLISDTSMIWTRRRGVKRLVVKEGEEMTIPAPRTMMMRTTGLRRARNPGQTS